MLQSSGLTPLIAGNIGQPVLDALTDGTQYDIAVLELSSFQLESTTHVPAEASAILNISADHMDRYDSMGDYVLAKARILRGARRAILPRHDEQLNQITNINQRLSFELDEPANDSEFGVKRQSGQRWLMQGEQRLMKLSEVPLAGLHNVKNVLSAFALIEFLDLPMSTLVDAVRRFSGLPHRMETVAIANGVNWVNDSKATNVGAASTALKHLESPVIWIAGGRGKEADFSQLKDAVSAHIKLLILFGEDAAQMELALDGLLPIQRVADMRAAVDLAGTQAISGDIVLLSPACASFDMFDGFEHRGESFRACVSQWLERGAA
jgi:UDP-N-acetylmuramoylalanine--D-glutamate ligase